MSTITRYALLTGLLAGVVLAIFGFLPWYQFEYQKVTGTDVHLIAIVSDGYWMVGAGLAIAATSAWMIRTDKVSAPPRFALIAASLVAFAVAVRNLTYEGDVCHPDFSTSGYVPGPSCLGWNGGDVFWGPVAGNVTATVWIAAALALVCGLIALGLPSIENRLYEDEDTEIRTTWA